jgi:uncharacterized membrane protein
VVLVRGLPGQPLHPPLTDATIGMYLLAAGLAIIGKAGGIELAASKGMWLALIGGLIVSVPTALSGLVDWLLIEWGSPRWRTATFHLTGWSQRSGCSRWPPGASTTATSTGT